ncbi:SDR family oxidoreductase [Candidatus Woesearchaeota archaeon]|nr:SDR family oxidoreductase [Candidatus Woesearchaeota archaeon]
MKILVTGGAGFIGSHLCEYLLGKGHEVICVDNYFTGSKKNIQHLLSNSNFKAIDHDIINPLFLEGKIDHIYNLACPASPIHYQVNKIRTIKACTVGMVNILGLAKAKKARILQASTSEVYGDPKIHPQHELYWGHVNCNGPRSCYDEGKRVAESLMMAYHWQNNIDTRIVRIFNTYGPRMAKNDGRVVSNFIVQALKGEPLTVYGKGKQTRSFCYVSDLVEGLYNVMNLEGFHDPINLGNPSEFTVIKLAKRIKKLTKSKSEIIFHPLPQDDPVKRKPDISLAKKLLCWEPKIELDEGLSHTIKHFKEML